jgi:hypothetical protein
MYICMYEILFGLFHIYTYICMHILLDVYMYIWICTNLCIEIHIWIYIYIYVYIHIYMRSCLDCFDVDRSSKYKYTHIFIYVFFETYVHVYLYIDICTNSFINICIYGCIYTHSREERMRFRLDYLLYTYTYAYITREARTYNVYMYIYDH